MCVDPEIISFDEGNDSFQLRTLKFAAFYRPGLNNRRDDDDDDFDFENDPIANYTGPSKLFVFVCVCGVTNVWR